MFGLLKMKKMKKDQKMFENTDAVSQSAKRRKDESAPKMMKKGTKEISERNGKVVLI